MIVLEQVKDLDWNCPFGFAVGITDFSDAAAFPVQGLIPMANRKHYMTTKVRVASDDPVKNPKFLPVFPSGKKWLLNLQLRYLPVALQLTNGIYT